MKTKFPALIALALVLLAASAQAAGLLVFAAASLTDCLTKAGALYQSSHGEKVEFSFEASSLLAAEIERGAPADLFASADEAKMDQLAAKGLVVGSSRKDLLTNTLVAVARVDSPLVLKGPEGLLSPKIGQLALADPRMVPAGIYAREYLTERKLWAALQPKTIYAGNVRGALQAVVSGNAEVGIVYRTDALISKKVRILFEVPAAQGPPIAYPFAVLASSAHPASARRFLAWLRSPEGSALFHAYGFSTLKSGT